MKKTFITFLSFTVLASIGLVVFSQTTDWENPAGPPPDFNVAKPLNQGLGVQIKEGALKILEGIGLGGFDPDSTSLVSTPSAFFGAPGAGTHIDEIDFESDVTAFLAKSDDATVSIGNPEDPTAKLTIEQTGDENVIDIRGLNRGSNLGTGQVVDDDFSGGSHSGTLPHVDFGVTSLRLERDTTQFANPLIWSITGNTTDIDIDDANTFLYILVRIDGNRSVVSKRRVSDGSVVWERNIDGFDVHALEHDNGFVYVAGDFYDGRTFNPKRWRYQKRDQNTGNLEWEVEHSVGDTTPSRTPRSLLHDLVIDDQFIYGIGVVKDYTDFRRPNIFGRLEKRKILTGELVSATNPGIGEDIRIADGKLYMDTGSSIRRFNPDDFSLEMSASAISTSGNSSNHGIVVDDDSIYIVGERRLGRYDRESGAEIFVRDIGIEAVAIDDDEDHVYFTGGGRTEKRRKSDGSLIWFQNVSGRTIYVEGDTYYVNDGTTLQKRSTDASNAFFTQGTFTSRTFDTGQQSDFFFLFPDVDLPSGTTANFQISTSNNNLDWTLFTGPNGTVGDFYISEDTPIHDMHHNKRYVRYQVTLQTTDTSRTPTLNSVVITFNQTGASTGDTKTHFLITTDGDVGIGTLEPRSKLDVAGEISQRGARLHADVAEDYRVVDDSDAGTIVRISSEGNFGVERSTGKHDERVIGVISTSPGYRINAGKPDWKPVALVGRVPVKVNLENGVIEPGDAITPSSTPGVGMKLIGDGPRVGFALDSFDGSEDTVFMFVNVSS